MSSDATQPPAVIRFRPLYLWASVIALLINFFIIPAFYYPTGAKSHYSTEGTVLAVVTGAIACYGLFGCPRRPLALKLGAALVCVFSAAVAMDAVIQFLRFGQGT